MRTIGCVNNNVNIEMLYGISTLGTKLCLYSVQRGRDIDPKAIVSNPVQITDTAPVGRWDVDILDPKGEDRVRELVAHIVAMCADFMILKPALFC